MKHARVLFISLLLVGSCSTLYPMEEKPQYKLINVWINNTTNVPIQFKKEPLYGGLESTAWDIISPESSQDVRLYYLSDKDVFQHVILRGEGEPIKTYRPSGNTPNITIRIKRDATSTDLIARFFKK